jgi:hypothetical protein
MDDITLEEARETFAQFGVDDIKMRLMRGQWQYVFEAKTGDAVGVGCHENAEVAIWQAFATFCLSRSGGRR